MSIQARDNRPGFFEYYTNRVNAQHDEEYDPNDGYQSGVRTQDHGVLTDFCKKLEPRHSDHKHPTDWRRQVGTVITDSPNRFSYYENRGNGRWARTTYTTWISSVMGQFAFNPILHDSENCQAEAEVEALNDLGGAKAQLGADIAQIRQTADMFADAVIRGGQFLRGVRRANLNMILQSLGVSRRGRPTSGSHTAANLWLEYAYGWKPLADSIYEYQDVLTQQLRPDRLMTGRGHGKANAAYQYVNAHGFQTQDTFNTSVKVVLKARASNDFLVRLNNLGVINPLSIAWELVPFSFVVDWFMPVGNTLDALSATLGLNFESGYASIKGDTRRSCHYDMKDRANDGHWSLIDTGKYVEEVFEFRRHAYDSFPIPQLYADLTPFSTPRVLNALALVRQLFK